MNAITRAKTASPFDHVALLWDGYVYESVSNDGVRIIKYEDWILSRKGSYLFKYDVAYNEIDFSYFFNNLGKKYDYKANLLYLFGYKKSLKKNYTKRFFCSELIAGMLKLKDPYLYTPEDIDEFFRKKGLKAKIEKL